LGLIATGVFRAIKYFIGSLQPLAGMTAVDIEFGHA
jgi:hypothetical protein